MTSHSRLSACYSYLLRVSSAAVVRASRLRGAERVVVPGLEEGRGGEEGGKGWWEGEKGGNQMLVWLLTYMSFGVCLAGLACYPGTVVAAPVRVECGECGGRS
jgi:hypothetical protein